MLRQASPWEPVIATCTITLARARKSARVLPPCACFRSKIDRNATVPEAAPPSGNYNDAPSGGAPSHVPPGPCSEPGSFRYVTRLSALHPASPSHPHRPRDILLLRAGPHEPLSSTRAAPHPLAPAARMPLKKAVPAGTRPVRFGAVLHLAENPRPEPLSRCSRLNRSAFPGPRSTAHRVHG